MKNEKNIQLYNINGSQVNISYDTINAIIENVAKNVPGIAEKEVNLFSKIIGNSSSKVQGYKDNVLEVNVIIKTYYGVTISAVARNFQSAIKEEMKIFLDIDHVIVNVYVTGVVFRENI